MGCARNRRGLSLNRESPRLFLFVLKKSAFSIDFFWNQQDNIIDEEITKQEVTCIGKSSWSDPDRRESNGYMEALHLVYDEQARQAILQAADEPNLLFQTAPYAYVDLLSSMEDDLDDIPCR